MKGKRLPDLEVIGPYKSGTTMLQRFLEEHPDVYVPERKEPNYWAFAGMTPADRLLLPSARWSVLERDEYERLFDDVRDEEVVAEVSPEYLASPHALMRLAETGHAGRFVAILRNPVDRAYSDFMLYRRDGVEPLEDFEQALTEQPARAAQGLPTGFYLETGRYAAQLRPWIDTFGRDRVLILLFDDLRADAVETARRLYEFAGVDAGLTLIGQHPVNASGTPEGRLLRTAYAARHRFAPHVRDRLRASVERVVDAQLQRRLTRTEIDDDVRDRLLGQFRDEIEALSDLLERPLDTWLDGRS